MVVLIHVTEIVAERSDNRSSNVQSFEPRVFSSHSAFFFPFLPDLPGTVHGYRRGRPPPPPAMINIGRRLKGANYHRQTILRSRPLIY